MVKVKIQLNTVDLTTSRAKLMQKHGKNTPYSDATVHSACVTNDFPYWSNSLTVSSRCVLRFIIWYRFNPRFVCNIYARLLAYFFIYTYPSSSTWNRLHGTSRAMKSCSPLSSYVSLLLCRFLRVHSSDLLHVAMSCLFSKELLRLSDEDGRNSERNYQLDKTQRV